MSKSVEELIFLDSRKTPTMSRNFSSWIRAKLPHCPTLSRNFYSWIRAKLPQNSVISSWTRAKLPICFGIFRNLSSWTRPKLPDVLQFLGFRAKFPDETLYSRKIFPEGKLYSRKIFLILSFQDEIFLFKILLQRTIPEISRDGGINSHQD